VSEVRRIEDAEVGRLLREQIDDHNIRTTGIAEWHPITFVVDDEHGEIVAGVDGWEWGGTCFVNALWVREDRLGEGLGSALMDAMEEAARDLGCRQMVLETHSFQAPAFYERRGFVRAGEVAGYPRGEAFILMRKPLTVPETR
jgi:GNAT superfamily N-acetyltransferase